MKRSNILCPECMKKKLLDKLDGEMRCDNCGTEFVKINNSTVKYK